MKKFMKTVAVIGALGILAASTTVFAAVKTPAQVAAGVTGKTTTELSTLRATGKTYGTIAKDAGKLAEFQKQMLAEKKAILDQRVKDKTLTQVQADAIYNAIKANQASCDGTGTARIGQKYNAGFGMGQGMGLGQGNCQGQGRGMGIGRGNR